MKKRDLFPAAMILVVLVAVMFGVLSGCLCYVMKNLIGHDWQGRPFLNLRWKRIE